MADNLAIGLAGNYAGTVEEFSAGGKAGVTLQGDWTSQTLDFSTTLLTGIAAINGGDGNDTITGSAAGDLIIGGSGNDTLGASTATTSSRSGSITASIPSTAARAMTPCWPWPTTWRSGLPATMPEALKSSRRAAGPA